MPSDTRETVLAAADLHRPHGTPEMAVRALLLGERLDTRALESGAVLATAPLALALDRGGVAVVLRYGVAVLFDAERDVAAAFLASLAPFVAEPFPRPEVEDARLVIGGTSEQQVDAAGNIVLRDRTVERLQVVADVLAKNLVLTHYETRVAAVFDRIEPLAARLRDTGRPGGRPKELLRLIGSVLGIQQRTVGRVETREKPELLWEHPELERLHMRLAEEYELRDRDLALDRKLDTISRTVQTLLSLVQTRSSTRLEWYILVLIFAELLVAAYPLLLHP